MPGGDFYSFYSTFSSSQIRCLQFSFRVLLSEGTASSTQTRGAVDQTTTIKFLNEIFEDLDDQDDEQVFVRMALSASPTPVARDFYDLHEFIVLIYHLREVVGGQSSPLFGKIVPKILQAARELQHRRIEVPAGQPVASDRQIKEAEREVALQEAKDMALQSGSVVSLQQFFLPLFIKYGAYWGMPLSEEEGSGKQMQSSGKQSNSKKKSDNSKKNKRKSTTTTTEQQPSKCTATTVMDASDPLLDHETVLRILSSNFWKHNESLEEELDHLIELRLANREEENKAMILYAEEFSREELEKFIQQFRTMDKDDSGTMDSREVGDAFVQAGIIIDEETLLEVVMEADEDESGEIDIVEWIGMQKAVRDGTSKAMRLLAEAAQKNQEEVERQRAKQAKMRADASAQRSAVLKRFPPQKLAMFRQTFNDFDADESGSVELHELVAMCAAMDMKVGKKKLKVLMNKVDRDGSGSIDFVEFVEMMDHGKKGSLSNIFYDMAHKHEMMADEKRRSVLKKRELTIKKKSKNLEKKSLKSSMRAEAKKKLSKLELAACKKTFETINIDESGALDEEELRDAFKILGLELSKKEVKKVFNQVDIDDDGTLDVDEYIICVAMCKTSSKYGKTFHALAEAGSKLQMNNNVREKMIKKKTKKFNKKTKRND